MSKSEIANAGVRRTLRSELQKLETDRRSLVEDEGGKVRQMLQSHRELVSSGSLKTTAEGVLSTKVVLGTTKIVQEQVALLDTGLAIDSSDFLRKLLSKYSLAVDGADEEEKDDRQAIDWVKVGCHALAGASLRTATVAGFLNGAIEIEAVVKPKAAKKARVEKNAPSQALETDLLTAANSSEIKISAAAQTDHRVDAMKAVLPTKPMEFIEFVLDPNSFVATVENIFDFGFPIKEGVVSLKVDPHGVAMIKKEEYPTVRDVDKYQGIISFDLDLFNRMKAMRPDIKRPYIQRSESAPVSGKRRH